MKKNLWCRNNRVIFFQSSWDSSRCILYACMCVYCTKGYIVKIVRWKLDSTVGLLLSSRSCYQVTQLSIYSHFTWVHERKRPLPKFTWILRFWWLVEKQLPQTFKLHFFYSHGSFIFTCIITFPFWILQNIYILFLSSFILE